MTDKIYHKEEKELQHLANSSEHQLDASYWDARWEKNETGWDTGFVSPAIAAYLSQYPDKHAAILIPGCGNAYEAEYLLSNGFTNITLIDISQTAVETLEEKFRDAAEIHVICEDFFNHVNHYDLIIEQTFFCAIPPSRRKEYAQKAASLLNENGKLIGVLFDKTFEKPGPPFGGHPSEYVPIFEPFFKIQTMETCYNSIPPRKNAEVFIIMNKK